MKIQLLSDLHIEFADYDYPACDADVVVLAGDIHVKLKGVLWAKNHIKDKPVIYVFGNHEYYGATYPKLLTQALQITSGSNIHVLENNSISIDGVNFLGCTLWTDFSLFGDPRIAGYHCQQTMNDYNQIRLSPNYSKIRSSDTALIHRKSIDWLSRTLEKHKADKNIVITHHGPSMASVPEGYKDKLVAAAYVSNLEDMIVQYNPVYWLHGHLHNSSNYTVSGCNIICNPKGYIGQENPKYDPLATFFI